MMEVDTSFGSTWSAKLTSVGIVVNRYVFDELDEAIACAARSVHRCL